MYLLSSDSKLQVLLLTGETGIGKTLFCKYLQRAILFEWDYSYSDTEERSWLPIVVDISSFMRSSKSTLTSPTTAASVRAEEILRRELSLTETEISFLRERQFDDDMPQIPQLPFLVLLNKISCLDPWMSQQACHSKVHLQNLSYSLSMTSKSIII